MCINIGLLQSWSIGLLRRNRLVNQHESLKKTNLKNNDDMRTMFSIFARYMTKRLIELDAKLVRLVEVMCSNLICPRTFDEITVCMIETERTKFKKLIYLNNIVDHFFLYLRLVFGRRKILIR
jgi:hypothetical protein